MNAFGSDEPVDVVERLRMGVAPGHDDTELYPNAILHVLVGEPLVE